MLRFNRLRLAGFKSFVDPTDLVIEPGLTAIVGPNGCGKSNLVEALRWVMGETSAKQIRGGEMDDVIFAGSAARPPRNIAEVVVFLDNTARAAPAAFNDSAEIEVSRRIERGTGSTYRINGKEVRARDVQLLFADSATGARSPAIVSQGRIGAVISAKPQERRLLLEEAAGIVGLHSRRHEAELRLRGAEGNLARLEDVLAALEVQLKSLKKQARQATRYRNLNDHIRRAEATLYLLRWLGASDELAASRQRLKAAEAAVAERTAGASAASRRHAQCAAALPSLRQGEAEAAAELQRLVLAREGLEAEEQRITARRAECETRLEHIAADIERERTLAADADAAIEALEREGAEIERDRGAEDASRAEAEASLAAANREAEDMEVRLTAVTERVASDEARRAELARTTQELEQRAQRLAARFREITEQREALERGAGGAARPEEAEARLAKARRLLDDARKQVEAAERTRAETADAAAEALSGLHAAEAAMTRLEAEERALAEVLEVPDGDSGPELIDAMTVEPGLEAALAAALGEDLLAPADRPAGVFWRTLEPYPESPALPAGAEPLSAYVSGPAALTRRLGQIGVVGDEPEGRRLADRLVQGQRLVSRDGALWRWDGFTIQAGTTTAAASRLEQRSRLKDVRGQLAGAQDQLFRARELAQAARARADEAAEAERRARDALRAADQSYAQARDDQAEVKERAAEQISRLAALAEAAEAIESERAETAQLLDRTLRDRDALPDTATARAELGRLRQELAGRRAVQLQRQSAFDNFVHAARERERRQEHIVRQLESWRQRREGAARRLEQLEERRLAVTAERERLASQPQALQEKHRELLGRIERAEAKRRAAADTLAEAETRLAEADRHLKAAESELAQAREERIRGEGLVGQAKQACRDITERVAERLDTTPEGLRALAGLADDAELPELEATERRAERLIRERETMGPVNLRAEQEARELSEQLDSLGAERGDLIKAIEKLRQGINTLNREGRERLLASFRQVDHHFQELFVHLFGGGRAHLNLVESDDPLEAGLEIMASPPGKRLQILSLLSGGEQALTALALLFAVFLTNPAPICVLDEVDAPLDDVNVDRFCALLGDLAHTGHTRFLVITHHRMTMARVDRLFGVTMQERGISQLVSVDLSRAEELRRTA